MALISVSIVGNAAPLKKSLDEADSSLEKFGGKVAGFGKAAALGIGAAAAGFGVFAASAIKGAEEARVADERLKQVADSMGLFGTQTKATTDRLLKLADTQEFELGVTAETIKLTQAKLLTFSELGKTADTMGGAFDRATTAAIDMAAAGFGSAETNAVQLGKALQDPIKGITALSRSGITFTEVEKERIRTLVESNKLGEAQALVLAAIETQVKGTAAATVTSSFKMGAAFGHIKDSVGEALLPMMDKLATFVVKEVIPAFNSFVEKYGPAITKTFRDFSDFIYRQVVPILRDQLLPFIQRVAEFIGERLVPVIRDVAVKTFEGLRRVFETVTAKIRDNQENIDKLVDFFRNLVGFVQQYVAPVLIKVLGTAFDVVAKAVGPVIDVVFTLIGAFADLGKFLLKIAGFVINTFEGMVNAVIDGVNFAIRMLNKLPGVDVKEIGNVSLPTPSLGAAPSAPTVTPTVPPGITDAFQRTIAPIGMPTFTPGVDEGPEEDEEEDGGKGRGGGGGGARTVRIAPVSMEGQVGIIGGIPEGFGGGGGTGAVLGTEAVLDGMTGGSSVVNVTINTVSTDANLPNLIVEALQQYNLVNGPIDVAIAV